MARAELIAEAERKLAEQEVVIAESIATYRGIEARLASLKEGVAIGGELAELGRTDAIVAVLGLAGVTLSPTEIMEALVEAGRTERMGLITGTLDYLCKKGRVQKVSRGRYLAV